MILLRKRPTNCSGESKPNPAAGKRSTGGHKTSLRMTGDMYQDTFCVTICDKFQREAKKSGKVKLKIVTYLGEKSGTSGRLNKLRETNNVEITGKNSLIISKLNINNHSIAAVQYCIPKNVANFHYLLIY